ncbi:helix-turn-helix domain-containing protein [Cryobacterium tagatosivorans]|uniref:DNA-binding protein n=1 Tax=Cryobacterium tagatosivorans TaxID=1259199 RepID=A0A4R8UF20_9MICO|nr:helix-turn-helix domain-containing protein [Cryobacterium tagatosivorans]TFB51061.1 DNA-binding protein [Cryobacterium tagatosivorans]
MSTTLNQQTYVGDDAAGVAKVHDFLAAHEAAGRETPTPQYFLAGATPGDQVQIPEEIHQILLQVIESMKRGLAVSIAPQSKTLTTQQAADLLGISRPTLVKLLDDGRIPFERVGTHRRVLLVDVMDYRERRRDEQYDALEEMRSSLDDETPVDEVLQEVRETRRARAAKRREEAAALPD